ncbi:TetR/AcrR family transcriptional regulator [Crassaminicella profunda]|uniref:TetR/AcrR family transcriptional regulator n=1 Tax=Crassaminicella profunda TaxID=1286698 RepID=UPI001CA7403D|nr:TetR/AcrR family transcriptional regulator [Crassaminicella profunda]QZY56113.1 TetR/AcrR family transcriptional regulator [Crassaminicella profunda]
MTSKKIKEAAFQLVAQKGYEGTTLAEIAKMVGIKKPSIYAHFSSKEEIFVTVLQEEVNIFCHYIDRIQVDVQSNHIEKIFMELLKKGMDYFYQDPMKKGFWRNILFCTCCMLKDQIKTSMIPLKEKIHDTLLLIIKGKVDNGEIQEQNLEDLVYSFECAMHGNFTMLLYDKFDYEKLKKSCHIYWGGIRKK